MANLTREFGFLEVGSPRVNIVNIDEIETIHLVIQILIFFNTKIKIFRVRFNRRYVSSDSLNKVHRNIVWTLHKIIQK